MHAAPEVRSVVDAAWLLEHAADPLVRVVDLRWYLDPKRRGEDAYAAGHVPGAVFVDLEGELTGTSGPGRHPLPTAAQVTAAMRRAGVGRLSHVVVYDDAGGSVAARLWWLLRHHGHPRVSVLDGGLPAWTAAGGPLESGGSRPAPPGDGRPFEAAPGRLPVVDRRYVQGAHSAGAAVILDARARERFRGDVEPIDARAGHVPGAKSAPWMENLEGGLFAPPERLRARYEALGVPSDAGPRAAGSDPDANVKQKVIVYCGSGVTACHDLLALVLAGFGDATLYEGGWSDWARDPRLPAALGDE